MTTNTFDTEESNSSISSPQYYVDDDGSLKFISPVLSSSNFDGSVPVFEGQIVASDLSPGKFIKIGEEYFPVLSVSYDDPELEEDPSEEITATYLDSNSEVQSVTYNLFDDVDVKYENWEEKYLGTQGWSLTYGGNAIFTNVAVRGDLEATTLNVGGENGITYDGTEVIIGASVTILGGLTIGEVQDYLDQEEYLVNDDIDPTLINPNVTSISGGVITTGTVAAARIDVDNLTVKSLLTTGQTNFSRIGIQPSLFSDRINFYSGLSNESIAPFISTHSTYSGGAIQPSWQGITIQSGTNNNNSTSAAIEVIVDRNSTFRRVWFFADIFNFFTGTIYGNGSGLTDLNGTNISTGTVAAARIADLDASKITSGTFGTARIPDLDASKITSGTFGTARIPTNISITGTSEGLSGGPSIVVNGITNQSNGITNSGGQITSLPTYNNASSLTNNMHITSSGVLRRNSSTQRIKEKITPLSGELSESVLQEKILNEPPKINFKNILNISPVEYTPVEDSDTERRVLGFIAEDIADKVPEIATYDDEGLPEYYDVNGIVAGLLSVIKDQQAVLDDLQDRMLQLESQLGG